MVAEKLRRQYKDRRTSGTPERREGAVRQRPGEALRASVANVIVCEREDLQLVKGGSSERIGQPGQACVANPSAKEVQRLEVRQFAVPEGPGERGGAAPTKGVAR